ncbi:MAG: hypothetical protein KGI37_05720 [Alphaproteobacteria bacterium]|nr:hypothetical protein [Alphaproteobacteria bacterium]
MNDTAKPLPTGGGQAAPLSWFREISTQNVADHMAPIADSFRMNWMGAMEARPGEGGLRFVLWKTSVLLNALRSSHVHRGRGPAKSFRDHDEIALFLATSTGLSPWLQQVLPLVERISAKSVSSNFLAMASLTYHRLPSPRDMDRFKTIIYRLNDRAHALSGAFDGVAMADIVRAQWIFVKQGTGIKPDVLLLKKLSLGESGSDELFSALGATEIKDTLAAAEGLRFMGIKIEDAFTDRLRARLEGGVGSGRATIDPSRPVKPPAPISGGQHQP